MERVMDQGKPLLAVIVPSFMANVGAFAAELFDLEITQDVSPPAPIYLRKI